MKEDSKDSQVYLMGGGLSSLASAYYLIATAKIPAANIHILEQDSILGGSLDGAGNADTGFIIRGGRMHESHFVCYWDLLDNIPSFEDNGVSVKEETFRFNELYVSNAQARLLKAGKIIPSDTFGLSFRQKKALVKLSLIPEKLLDNQTIEEWFDDDFFTTVFWYLWTSMFAFQRWSSLAHMRRYMRRFIHLVDGLPNLKGILRTKYNQYHSVVTPLVRFLQQQGVDFQLSTQVTDIDFDLNHSRKIATGIHLQQLAMKKHISLRKQDYVFITNGSITDATDLGSFKHAPTLKTDKTSAPAWRMWENIAAKDPCFGRPHVFSDTIDLQKWYSFTVTLKDCTFHDYMESFSGNIDGTGGLVTLTDSNWLMSFVIPRQPHFPNQPDDVKVFWGYGLYANKKGNFVNKPMSQCSGRDILLELWGHLKIQELMRPILEAGNVNCIPVAMPYIDSLFMPYALGDRPKVVPKGAKNFAFIGQFAEVKQDCVFTVEYSVRTALIAVNTLFKTDKKPPPIYKSIYKPNILFKALRALFR